MNRTLIRVLFFFRQLLRKSHALHFFHLFAVGFGLFRVFFRHLSVDQKSVKCIGEAYLMCNTLVMSLICSDFSPKISHPSGDLRASRWSTCLVSPACICALSMPISRSTCPLPWRNHVLGRPRSSGKYEVFTVGISSLMLSMPIT